MLTVRVAGATCYTCFQTPSAVCAAGFCVVGRASSAQRRAQLEAVACSAIERMEDVPCALKNTKIIETAVMGGLMATALLRLATAACCEASGVLDRAFEISPADS